MDLRIYLFTLALILIIGPSAAAVAADETPVPTIVCTPPLCPTGSSYACPADANGCPGGCGMVCATPTTPPSAGEPLVIIGGIGLCLVVIGRQRRK